MQKLNEVVRRVKLIGDINIADLYGTDVDYDFLCERLDRLIRCDLQDKDTLHEGEQVKEAEDLTILLDDPEFKREVYTAILKQMNKST